MGSFNFKWEHPAEEVYVTGTFDKWSKSVKLDKKGDLHEKTVDLPETTDKILYKFVADGQWSHDHTAPTDTDHEGNVNNVLYPTDMTPSASTAATSSVAPGASTTQMAGEQPLTKSLPTASGSHDAIPGAFPETPAALGNDDEKAFGVNPIPASEGAGNPITLAPGDKVPDPSSFNNNSTIHSNVRDDPSLKESAGEAEQTFGVAPLPATEGAGNPISLAPGEKVPDSSTFTNSTIQSNVRDDPSLKESAEESEQAFGVAPLPATEGAGNPISLAPGEKVPHPSTFTNNTIDNNVRLDKESYERSDTGAPMLPALSPGTEREAAGAPIFGLGPTTGNNIIPESSLPMGDKAVSDMSNTGPHMSSAAPGSTTADLAGKQPIEPRGVPEVVSDSQEKAQTDPEASNNPEAVVEKTEVENELKQKVPEEPSTSESGMLGKSENNAGGIAGGVAAGLATAGTASAAGVYAMREKAAQTTGKDPVEAMPKGVQDSINNMQNKGTTAPPLDSDRPLDTPSIPQQRRLGEDVSVPAEQGASSATTNDVPSEVVTSQKEARVDPEASANPEAVHEKSAMEQQLLSEIKPTQETGEPAPTASAAPAATAAKTSTNDVPEEVVASQKEAHIDPEASANPDAVHEKSAMEKELLSEVQPTEAAGEPAPTASAALAETAPAATTTTTSASGAPQLADPVADVSPISMDSGKSRASEIAERAMGAPLVAGAAGGAAGASITGAYTTTPPVSGSKELNAPAGEPATPAQQASLAAPASTTDTSTTEPPVPGSQDLNAPASSPATPSQQANLAAPAPPSKPMDSRDVSPMSKIPTANHTAEPSSAGPSVTTGVDSSSAPAQSNPPAAADDLPVSKPIGSRPAVANSTPQKRGSFMDRMKGTPDSTRSDASASESTKKRRSLFGRIKDKLKA